MRKWPAKGGTVNSVQPSNETCILNE
jgi:hypothetical protein